MSKLCLKTLKFFFFLYYFTQAPVLSNIKTLKQFFGFPTEFGSIKTHAVSKCYCTPTESCSSEILNPRIAGTTSLCPPGETFCCLHKIDNELLPTPPKQPVFFNVPTHESNCICRAVGERPTMQFINPRIVAKGSPPSCPDGEELYCVNSTSVENPPISTDTCGKRQISNSAPQLVGTALKGGHPWQAALLSDNYKYIGSGVLISPRHILTAAHKVQNFAPFKNFQIVLGAWDIKSVEMNSNTYRPSHVFIHPDFHSRHLLNDVAVVRLKGPPVEFNSFINKVCYPTAVPSSGTRCWVAGWGADTFESNIDQNILKEIDVPIIDSNVCERQLRNTSLGPSYNLNRNSFICAGGEAGKDACTNDGGAPLVCQSSSGKWEVVGLVAGGVGCATANVPGLYVNVYNFLPWIREQINKQINISIDD